MRTTLETVDLAELSNVTGGCKKKAPPPPPQQQAMAPSDPSGVEVTVATGAQAAQLINPQMA